MKKKDIDIKQIRELAKKFTSGEIESCIQQQLKEGENICDIKGPIEYVIGELAKAEVVKKLMEEGMSISDAVRELARRIRLVQKGFKEE